MENNEKAAFVDLYEALQLSPNADSVTIERVFRLLARRFHPDNKETCNPDSFKLVVKAYRTLRDEEGRAAYDEVYRARQKLKSRVSDPATATDEKQTSKEFRRGLLSQLYAKRISDFENPGMTILEIEDALGCVRGDLQVVTWYLRAKGLIEQSSEGQHAITPEGMDTCDEWEADASPEGLPTHSHSPQALQNGVAAAPATVPCKTA